MILIQDWLNHDKSQFVLRVLASQRPNGLVSRNAADPLQARALRLEFLNGWEACFLSLLALSNPTAAHRPLEEWEQSQPLDD